VEIQYRAGIRSLKDIGAEFEVSDAGILKRAKRDGWVRDLKAKIRAKADAKVSASLVSGEVSPQTKVAEAQVIEVEATVQARVRLAHRTDIARGRTLVMNLLSELEQQTGGGALYEQLAELLHSDEEDAPSKRRELLSKVIALPARTKTMKDLADSLRVLIGLEREAFGIGELEPPPDENNIDLGRAADLRSRIRGHKSD
jgi:hypothetical protein